MLCTSCCTVSKRVAVTLAQSHRLSAVPWCARVSRLLSRPSSACSKHGAQHQARGPESTEHLRIVTSRRPPYVDCASWAPMATNSVPVKSGDAEGRTSDPPASPGSGVAWGARGQRHPRKLAHDSHVPTFLPFASPPQSRGRSTAISTAKRPASARLKACFKQQAKRRRKSPSPSYSPSPSPPPQRRKARAAARSPTAEPGLSLPQIREQECTILAAINQAALQKKLTPEVAQSFQAQLDDLAVLKHRLDPSARQHSANRWKPWGSPVHSSITPPDSRAHRHDAWHTEPCMLRPAFQLWYSRRHPASRI